MAKRRKYKVGDRIFFEHTDSIIDTAIVLKTTEQSYIDDNGKEVSYQWLTTWEDEIRNHRYHKIKITSLVMANQKVAKIKLRC